MKKLITLITSIFLLGACTSNKSNNNAIPSQEDKTVVTGDSNILVAYFSVTNHTEGIALSIKEHLNCDIYEILPLEPYTDEDIDYNSDCRANREQNDETSRPVMGGNPVNIANYDTVILGYPIWWGQAPKIMYTFVESYDLAGKTILPFCTSGSSSIGDSATNLAKSEPNAKWLEGKRFAANTDQETIKSWLDQYFKKETNMNLYIDNNKVDVSWENNDSVKALKEILPVTINMHEYGGFEQTGAIGQSIVRNDTQIYTVPGDIVLYAGNQISVFYGNNSYSYTRLGHINLSKNELNALLNKDNVTFALRGE